MRDVQAAGAPGQVSGAGYCVLEGIRALADVDWLRQPEERSSASNSAEAMAGTSASANPSMSRVTM